MEKVQAHGWLVGLAQQEPILKSTSLVVCFLTDDGQVGMAHNVGSSVEVLGMLQAGMAIEVENMNNREKSSSGIQVIKGGLGINPDRLKA